MQLRALLALLAGSVCAVACVVPGFEVGPSAGVAGAGGGAGAAGTGGAGSGGAGMSGTGGAGTGGGSAPGPFRVGFSMFHDSAAGNDNASAGLTYATFNKPPGTAPGDFMLVFFGADHALANLTPQDLTPLGWTLHDQHENYGTDGQGSYLLYKFAGANEPASITFAGINSPGGGNGVQGLLSVYRGVNTTTPINAYAPLVEDSGTDTQAEISTPTPSITTTADNCLLIAGLSPDSFVDAPIIVSWPAGFSEDRVSVINPPNPYPFGWANIYSAEQHLPSAGLVPASAFVWDMKYGGTQYFGALSFVLALGP